MKKASLVLALVVLAAAESRAQQAAHPRGLGISGIPAVGFDADEGFGYGAILQVSDYGDGTVAPYRFMLQPTVFFTSKGRRDMLVFVDAPHALPGDWRFSGIIGRQQQLATPYYGTGNTSVFNDALVTKSNPYYYRYGRTVRLATGNLQHSIGLPSVRLLVGAGIQDTKLKATPYDSGTTLFAATFGTADAPASTARYVRGGLVVDTRDREIGTHSGNWSDLIFQKVGLGGDESFNRITGTFRQFVPLGERLTFAERVLVQTTTGNPPVWELSYVQSSFRDDEALGGATSIRGIPRNRYVGKGVAFSNSELRWDVAHFDVMHHSTSLILSGFVDAGRVWQNGVAASSIIQDLHVGYGGGAHLAIGPTFVVTGDVGHSSQSTAAIYLGVGYLF